MATPVPVIWDYTKNKFVAMGGSGGGGFTVYPEESGSGGSIVTDTLASNGTCVTKTSTASTTVIMSDAKIQGLDFGAVSISVRLKTSNITASGNSILIRTYYAANDVTTTKTLLTTTYIKGTDFAAANTYQNFGIICNFKGAMTDDKVLNVHISTVSGYAATLSLDYIKSSPTFPGAYYVPTIQN